MNITVLTCYLSPSYQKDTSKTERKLSYQVTNIVSCSTLAFFLVVSSSSSKQAADESFCQFVYTLLLLTYIVQALLIYITFNEI